MTKCRAITTIKRRLALYDFHFAKFLLHSTIFSFVIYYHFIRITPTVCWPPPLLVRPALFDYQIIKNNNIN